MGGIVLLFFFFFFFNNYDINCPLGGTLYTVGGTFGSGGGPRLSGSESST
jgi:hypothetical protein